MTRAVSTLFLRDSAHGGPAGQLAVVADHLAAFVHAARASVDVAIYDFRLTDPATVRTVVGALVAAADRGVVVRIGYDAGKPAATDGRLGALAFAAVGGDPAPLGTADWVTGHFAGTKVQTLAVHAGSQLMHHKYVLCDAADPGATTAVWTGSTNFTDDAWTRQENNVLVVHSEALAAAYLTDFAAMWTTGRIAGSGLHDSGSTRVGRGSLGWDFCPGDGAAVDAALAARIETATQRLLVASMVITSHGVLAALAAAVRRGVPLSGVYDATQMGPIATQWKASGSPALPDWLVVRKHLAGKRSTPYSPTGLHDFMHLKVLVADGTAVTGSYNFSANAERNAENQVYLDDPVSVAAYASLVTRLAEVYA